MTRQITFETPWGWVLLEETNGSITKIQLPQSEQPAEEIPEESPLLLEGKRQILEYLQGSRREIRLPYRLQVPAFSKAVLQQLPEIPYGETRTYGQWAQKLKKPGAARAVGNALHRNPLPLLLPCHRIVGANGALGGFAGGIEMKKRLLLLEGAKEI